MKIEHIAIWVSDIEKMAAFYGKYFDASVGNVYHNPDKKFTSRFVSFTEGCRIELMHNPTIAKTVEEGIGLTHFAISIGSKEIVDELTEKLESDGYTIVSNPRTTGDGYYVSVVFDPEGNRLEITV